MSVQCTYCWHTLSFGDIIETQLQVKLFWIFFSCRLKLKILSSKQLRRSTFRNSSSIYWRRQNKNDKESWEDIECNPGCCCCSLLTKTIIGTVLFIDVSILYSNLLNHSTRNRNNLVLPNFILNVNPAIFINWLNNEIFYLTT